MYIHVYNKRPTGHNGHLSNRHSLSPDLLSEGLMFEYEQPHQKINNKRCGNRIKAGFFNVIIQNIDVHGTKD